MIEDPDVLAPALMPEAPFAVTTMFDLPPLSEWPALALQYANARPFPHLALDGVLVPAFADLDFPKGDWAHWTRIGDGYQRQKHTCADISRIPPRLRALIEEACQPAFLRFLETLTGIRKLLPDPYLEGGGLHASGPGGILSPHTDFHLYERLGLYRRINLLVYLNEGWTAEDGGALELYERGSKVPEASVVPVYGRIAVFTTDDRSVHGFTRPVAAGKWRNSVALYYYTSTEAPTFSGDRDTHWQQHGRNRGVNAARIAAWNAFIYMSRVFSKFAHMANPYIGKNASSPLREH